MADTPGRQAELGASLLSGDELRAQQQNLLPPRGSTFRPVRSHAYQTCLGLTGHADALWCDVHLVQPELVPSAGAGGGKRTSLSTSSKGDGPRRISVDQGFMGRVSVHKYQPQTAVLSTRKLPVQSYGAAGGPRRQAPPTPRMYPSSCTCRHSPMISSHLSPRRSFWASSQVRPRTIHSI